MSGVISRSLVLKAERHKLSFLSPIEGCGFRGNGVA